MEEIQTIEFVDSDTKESGVAVIRAGHGTVGIALSLEKSADVEVFLPTDVGRSLLSALERALALASS